MKKILLKSTLLAVFVAYSGLPLYAHAQELDQKQARQIIAPFYDALNAAPGKDATALVLKATAPNWVSCSDNSQNCAPRDKVVPKISGFHKAIPDLKWEIKEVLVDKNRVIVRGEAIGTPAGDFMGVPHGGKTFKIMSIDIHTVDKGLITHSYHVEDWFGAIRQLSGK